MNHLGVRLSALVDGELGDRDRDRLLVHVAGCAACRAELEAERAVKARVGALGAWASPPPELLERLRALPGPSAPLPPAVRSMPWGALAPRVLPPPASRPRRSRLRRTPPSSPYAPPARGPVEQRRRRRRRVTTSAAGAASVLAVVLGTAFVAGGEPARPQAPAVVPAVDSFTVQHARTTSRMPLQDPARMPAVVEVARVDAR